MSEQESIESNGCFVRVCDIFNEQIATCVNDAAERWMEAAPSFILEIVVEE